MRKILSIILLIVSYVSVAQNEVDLRAINWSELSIEISNSQNNDVKAVKVEEMNLCSSGSVEDSRFENRIGYSTTKYPGIVFQKARDNNQIAKIHLTPEFKGTLLDGEKVDVSNLTAEMVLVKNPKLNTWNSSSCSNYWSLTDNTIFYYIKIDKNHLPQYPLDEKYYRSKSVAGIDIILKSDKMDFKKSSEPLYVLDGKEISRQEMDKLKPNDIEAVTILKDISAIAKYQDKGKNGVVEISLKK